MPELAAPYCTVNDLLLSGSGWVEGTGVAADKAGWVQRAATEMTSKLGFIYKLPLEWDPGPIPEHEEDLLKTINAKIATGRILLGTTNQAEQDGVHDYGWRLLQEGQNDLMMLANGLVRLSASPTTAEAVDDATKGPHVHNKDGMSMIDAFEANMMREDLTYIYPGEVTP